MYLFRVKLQRNFIDFALCKIVHEKYTFYRLLIQSKCVAPKKRKEPSGIIHQRVFQIYDK